MWWWPQLAQPATCPPSASVRQASIADITFSWVRLICPALARRHAGPWVRKMSASSSEGRGTPPRLQSGPSDRSTLSCTSFICSKGLTVLWIVLVATWAYRAVVLSLA